MHEYKGQKVLMENRFYYIIFAPVLDVLDVKYDMACDIIIQCAVCMA